MGQEGAGERGARWQGGETCVGTPHHLLAHALSVPQLRHPFCAHCTPIACPPRDEGLMRAWRGSEERKRREGREEEEGGTWSMLSCTSVVIAVVIVCSAILHPTPRPPVSAGRTPTLLLPQ